MIALPLDLRRLARSESPYYRASFFVCLGAVVMVLAGLVDFSQRVGLIRTEGMMHLYLPYSLWTSALFLFSIGFLWLGIAADYTKAALWVALIHVVQALNILVVVIAQAKSPISPASLSVGRLLMLLIFTVTDRGRLPLGPRWLLVGGVALQLVKISARAIHLIPTEDSPLWASVDTVLLLWLAAALLWIGSSFLRSELKWELEQGPEEAIGLAEFNNPEHPWNKKPRDKNPV